MRIIVMPFSPAFSFVVLHVGYLTKFSMSVASATPQNQILISKSLMIWGFFVGWDLHPR
jgi:hypothetical protein